MFTTNAGRFMTIIDDDVWPNSRRVFRTAPRPQMI